MAIQTVKATIQMRRGLERDFDADQMTAGEWAVSTDTKYVRMCFAPGIVYRMATYEAFEEDMKEIQTILATCKDIQTAVDAMAKLAEQHKNDAKNYSTLSKSYAVGGTGTRTNENVDNAKYYYEQTKSVSEELSGTLNPMGTVTFANLPALSAAKSGWMYNVSNQFTTTSDFKEGAGHVIPAGSNVYKTADGKWDVLAGTPVSTVNGETGDVLVTPANIGALAKSGDTATGAIYNTKVPDNCDDDRKTRITGSSYGVIFPSGHRGYAGGINCLDSNENYLATLGVLWDGNKIKWFYAGKDYNNPDGIFKAAEFIGKFTGNADTATKATKDGDGNVISDTYLPLTGGIISNDDKSMNLLPRGIEGDDGQHLTGFNEVQAKQGDFDELYTEKLLTNSDAYIDGDLRVCQKMVVDRQASFADNVQIDGDLKVDGKLAVDGKVELESDLDMGAENIENVGHIRGQNGQDIDFDGENAEFVLTEKVGSIEYVKSGIKCKKSGGLDLIFGDTGTVSLTYANVKSNKLSETEVLYASDSQFKLNISDEVSINGNEISLVSDWFNIGNGAITQDHSNNLYIGKSKDTKLNLRSGNDIRLEATNGYVKTTKIQGIKDSSGNKPTITNFSNINCETLNSKIPKYNVAVLADYTSVGRSLNDISWAQIKADVDSGNVNKYCVGDYKDITITTGYKFRMRIAGINTYSGKRNATGNGYLGCHIDWISDECAFSTKYNDTATNNGISGNTSPYTSSYLWTYLQNTVITYIPQEIQNVISGKCLDIDGRYSASGSLSYSNYYLWNINIGKLWIPTEFEVMGFVCRGSNNGTSSGSGGQRQYPLFRDYPRFTQKRDTTKFGTTDANMQPWWFATADGSNSANFLGMGWQGYEFSGAATDVNKIPICFRIVASSTN